jgi:glycerol-3-phosphate dehydrogenase
VARSASGLVSITGGKLTTYREMAADTVDEVIDVLGRASTRHVRRRSRTKRLRLRGADGYESAQRSAGSDETLLHLLDRYGDEARSVLALADKEPSLRAPMVPGLPYIRAEAVYAARNEMALSLDDVLTRRTRARLLGRDATVAVAAEVAALIAPELGWDDAEQAAQVTRYQQLVKSERASAHLPETAIEAAIGR